MRNRPNPMPDKSLRNSLAWVHTMPTGDGKTPSVPSGPVVEYETRTVIGRKSQRATEVVEWLYAEIKKEHLDKGSSASKAMGEWVRSEVGVKDDQAGHIVASRLGGPGNVTWNIFPQNANLNMGVHRADVEDMIYQEVQMEGIVKIWFHFVYHDSQHPGRPDPLQFYFRGSYFGDQSDDVVNPLSLALARSCK